jgi:GNAT superfamily N-acetyltransferase
MSAGGRALPDPAEAVHAFFDTLAHRCALVDGSSSRRGPGLWLLDEKTTHQNPFPRTFPFRKSFFALKDDPEALCASVGTWLDTPEEGHVLNLFCSDPEREAVRYAAWGYELSWTFDLFARSVDGPAVAEHLPSELETVPVDSALVEAINAGDPEYPSSALTLPDERIHEIALLHEGMPVAKGEIIWHAPDFVHVMGMVTRPAFRRRGLGRHIMDALLSEARAGGARWAVLNASLEATRFDFYPRLGFEPVARCARLVPGPGPSAGPSAGPS